MDTMEAIRKRRSIRKYTKEPVPAQTVKELLTAAMYAPSAGDAQPWQFVVVDRRDLLDKVETVHPYAAMAREAPLAILVCGDLKLEKYPGNWIADCSAATQNLLLAAHEKGLGTVWCGVYPNADRIPAFRKFFNLPEHVVPLALVVVGHPAEKKPTPVRFKKERVHENTW